VTVGVPTYNRPDGLRRAVESVLAQTYRELDVVISDNASTDGTEAVCRSLAAADDRVRYVRQPHNLGLTENFNFVLSTPRTEFVMALADDDRLESDFVERCVAALDTDSSLVAASGAAHYGAAHPALLDLLAEDPAERVRRYFDAVRAGVAFFYGLIRREALDAALPLQNRLAGDWQLCGRLAMQGRMRTVEETWINRSDDGTSASYAGTVRSLGLTAREARHPHLAIATFIYFDIARDAAVYAPLGTARRRRLAAACAFGVLRARPFNIVDDALRPLLSRPRLRSVDHALHTLVRRLEG
jgi:glycosyltransferase involved in cell wall biosynthesis